MLTQPHHSSPILILDFHVAVSLYFVSLEAFPISAKKSPWFVENQFTLILFDIFLWKFKHLPSCSQHSLNLKQNKVDLIAKPTFQEAIQCHHTQKLLRYNPYINIPLYQIKNHCLFLISVMLYWTSASGCSKFALTVSLSFRNVYL